MTVLRIVCMSYLPLGYATPQIGYLLSSLQQYYGSTAEVHVAQPLWSLFPQSVVPALPGFHLVTLPTMADLKAPQAEVHQWLRALQPNILIVTHIGHLQYLKKLKSNPFVIFYNFEGYDGQEWLAGYVRHAVGWLEQYSHVQIFPEKHRMQRWIQEYPISTKGRAILLLNVHPKGRFPTASGSDCGNGRAVYQGSVDFSRTYIAALCQPTRPALWCDIFAHIGEVYPEACIRDEHLSKSCYLSYKGFVPNERLAEIRQQYSFSLVLWKPITEEMHYACPNKFFEAIASGVPPISTPHPQCREILEQAKCGILATDWSTNALYTALDDALDAISDGRQAQMSRSCLEYHYDVLNWETQFMNLRECLS